MRVWSNMYVHAWGLFVLVCLRSLRVHGGEGAHFAGVNMEDSVDIPGRTTYRRDSVILFLPLFLKSCCPR
jgi:hypothetical protein